MTRVQYLDQVLSGREITTLLDVWHRFPQYRTVGSRPARAERRLRPAGRGSRRPPLAFAPELGGRVDANRNRAAQAAPDELDDPLFSRRNLYLRETYADGGEPVLAGIRGFLHHPTLIAAATSILDAPRVVPWHVYANVFLPGQGLGVHTDVPEFRGAGRNEVPHWLLVVMHHSGLFERWRLRTATAVVYATDCDGGDFRYYSEDRPVPFRPHPNSGVIFDADTVFHAVERVAGDEAPLSDLAVGARILREGRRSWVLRSRHGADADNLASYSSDQLRYSVSWKAYCFRDQQDHDQWLEQRDELDLTSIVPSLTAQLAERGRVTSPEPGLPEEELGLLLIDEFVPFPPVSP